MLHVNSPEEVQIERLRLACWMLLNGERLIGRRLQSDGTIVYLFERTAKSDSLIRQWEAKTPREADLARFSNIVSFEIRKAIRMRRAAGLPTRITSAQKS